MVVKVMEACFLYDDVESKTADRHERIPQIAKCSRLTQESKKQKEMGH